MLTWIITLYRAWKRKLWSNFPQKLISIKVGWATFKNRKVISSQEGSNERRKWRLLKLKLPRKEWEFSRTFRRKVAVRVNIVMILLLMVSKCNENVGPKVSNSLVLKSLVLLMVKGKPNNQQEDHKHQRETGQPRNRIISEVKNW